MGLEYFNLQTAGLSRTLSRRFNPVNCSLVVHSEIRRFRLHVLGSRYSLSSFKFNMSDLGSSSQLLVIEDDLREAVFGGCLN